MNFFENFLRLLPHKPRQALAALYWQLTRRKVRARNRLRVASADLPFAYNLWMATIERNPELTRNLQARVETWSWRPRFSVLLYAQSGCTKGQLSRSIISVEQQSYPDWKIVDVGMDGIENGVAAADGDYVVPLKAGDLLSEAALFRFGEALQTDPLATIIYGDQDELDDRGRRARPWFKPRWNQEMFLAQDFLSSAVAIEAGLARKTAEDREEGKAADFSALLLAATAATEGPIVHVPHIICHVASPADEPSPGRVAVVAEHVNPLGAACAPGPFGTVKMRWPLPSKSPLVTIIVPTKDKLELLRPCVTSVLEQTTYEHFELLIVDNESVEKRTADYLDEIGEKPRVRVIVYPGPYNFSAINNFAVANARGSYLCLLNNDTEVIEAEWLTEMMRYAVRPEVGAVGAKLLYEDGSIQHAGVVVGIGEAAGHAHRFLPADQPGYFRQAHVAQFVSAVTAACMVVDKDKFEAVGCLDERHLAVAFNDVDLCLKLEAAGWRNVYVPHAILLHHESKSRGKDISPENFDRYRRELKILQDRWGTKTYEDPLHNPNLDRYTETFVFRL